MEMEEKKNVDVLFIKIEIKIMNLVLIKIIYNIKLN